MTGAVAIARRSPSKARKSSKASHPPYKNMVKAAIKNLKGEDGTSRQAILKYIVSNYNVGDEKKASTRVCLALKRASGSGELAHAKGSGAAGSFQIVKKGRTAKSAKRGKKSKAKKSAVKKISVTKPTTKTVSTPKKPKAKKAKRSAARKGSKKSGKRTKKSKK